MISLSASNTIVRETEHICSKPDFIGNTISKEYEKCKQRIGDGIPVMDAYEEFVSELKKLGLEKSIPDFKNIKTVLYRTIKKK